MDLLDNETIKEEEHTVERTQPDKRGVSVTEPKAPVRSETPEGETESKDKKTIKRPKNNGLKANINTLARHLAVTFVRKDGRFFMVNNPGNKLSRDDVQHIAVKQFGEQFPEIELTDELVRGVFKKAITTTHNDAETGIQVWNGMLVNKPDVASSVISADGLATINSWRRPTYRGHAAEQAEYGLFGEFLDLAITEPLDRVMLLDWLAWALQNEADKPNWAPFLYSQKKGTGKSTICKVIAALFGAENTMTENSVNKLTSRFNLPMLMSKLVICEEIILKPGSAAGNTLKTYITEKVTASEAKGREVQRVDQCCCFIFTSNHMPSWIEADDRRYLVIDLDHDGHATGPNAEDFGRRAGQLEEMLQDNRALKTLYNALMTRRFSNSFNAKSLNVATHETPIMKRIFAGARTVVLDQLEELLNEEGAKAVSQKYLVKIATERTRCNPNQLPHLMATLGWNAQSVKWGGVDYERSLYVKDGYRVYRGKVYGPDDYCHPVGKEPLGPEALAAGVEIIEGLEEPY